MIEGEKTVINTQSGYYSIYGTNVYRGQSGNGALVGVRVIGAIDTVPDYGVEAMTNGEFNVTNKGIEQEIRCEAKHCLLKPRMHPVVETDEQKLVVLPAIRELEKRKTKSVRLEGIVKSQDMHNIS